MRVLSTANWLEGKQVALAGRLASMSRREAAQLIAAHGGVVCRRLTGEPSIVIVGREGWPLARDGRPAPKLRRALALAKQGYDVQIVPEEELLARLHCPGDRLQRHSTLRELATLLQIPAERLAQWVRGGLVKPVRTIDGIHYFDFCQVAGAKTLCDLVREGISPARLRQSLQKLRAWLGDLEHPLAQLTTLEQGQVVVRLDSGQLAEPSGQLLFEFSTQTDDALPSSVPWVGQARSAADWFELGCQAEDRRDYGEAVRAFRQALLAGGPSAEACFNLANCLYSLGQFARASERYRQVIELDPGFWEAWNNLATVLTYEGQNEEAASAYRQALRLHPTYADAHYNLADTLDDLGRLDEARHHWQAYLELEPTGDGADYARGRLRELR